MKTGDDRDCAVSSQAALDGFRARFPAHLDADDFHLIGLEP
jgi:hypothetical protein